MTEEKTRVDFNAPASLVERTDSVVEILDTSRTRLLIDALEGVQFGVADSLDERLLVDRKLTLLVEGLTDGREGHDHQGLGH